MSIDTTAIGGLMRRTRTDRQSVTSNQIAQIEGDIREITRGIAAGRVPPEQPPATYGAVRPEPGRRIAAAETGLQDLIRQLDDDHALLVDEINHIGQLIADSEKRKASMEAEAASIATMRDGAKGLLGLNEVSDEIARGHADTV
jgi:hypothetical protein